MFVSLILAVVFQVTPPPSPPPLISSPSPSASPSAAPSATPSPTPSPLAVSTPQITLHPSQSVTTAILGGVGPYTAAVDTPLVTATIDQTARTLTVTATAQTGRAVVTLNDSTGTSVQIPVRVALDAGSVPAVLTLRVTGTQPDAQWLSTQIQHLVARSATLQPGVTTVQAAAFTLPPSLGPGATADIPVQVHISGGQQYLDVDANTTITLQNVAAAAFTPPLLYYDDDPEKIAATGVLFRALVNPGQPARLYYYHENTSDDHDLAVVISSNSAATVQLIDASAGPNIDVMTVGHVVSRDFLQQKPLNEGTVVDVNAQAPYVADYFAMHRLDGAAGNIGINILSGAAVTVTVLALPPNADLSPAQLASYLAQPQLPDDGHHRTGAFSLVGYGQETIAFTAPGPEASVQYGAQTPPAADVPNDPVPTGHDYGEYGVLRTLEFQIDNPLDQPQTLYLYERPMGGAVRSSFLVNGQLVQVGCARVPDRYKIGDPVVVQPNAKLMLPVQTMTDGGSSYPLEVGITATPPQPSVPPISAPDGCFPKPQGQASPVPASPTPQPEPTG